MNTETLFRIVAFATLIAGAGISIYYRSKADRETGESISPTREGMAIFIPLRLAGLALWLSVFAYIINPAWMAWAQVDLPLWVRWSGLFLGILTDFMLYWQFSSIGNNISPTVVTRQQHQLITRGPYRWIRHPLYTFGTLGYLAFALLAANWFIALMAVTVFGLLSIRLPQEEAALIAKFGDEYRFYMKRTGAFLPKLFWFKGR
jgi:protein-S-isoprenylcysteine O-methyltransferase Ste14